MHTLIWSIALAADGYVPVQGMLFDEVGAPLSGTHLLTFRLTGQNGQSPSDELLVDPQQVVIVGGTFAAQLGTSQPLNLDHFGNYEHLRLTVSVDGGTPSDPAEIFWAPRAAFALHAATAGEAATALVADELANPYTTGNGLQLNNGEFSVDYNTLDAYTRTQVDDLVANAGGGGGAGGSAGGNGATPPAEGIGSFDTPGQNCEAILESNPSAGTGSYYVLNGGESAYQVWCDMTTGGGGWTLALQTSGASPFTYSHAVWTATSAPLTNVTSALVDQDVVSPSFYLEAGEESMLCFGSMQNCAAWDHGYGTPRALVNGTALVSTPSGGSLCTTLKCPPASLPRALNAAIPPTTAGFWYRFGYLNQTNAYGTKIRVGFSADVDSSDSLDTIVGLGVECTGTCLSTNVTGGPHNTGSGYYKYNTVSSAPHSGTTPAFLFVRARTNVATQGTQSNPAVSCKSLLAARPSLLNQSGLYWLKLPSGGAYQAYCEMSSAKGGGGWTLVMTTASSSTYVRSHAVWTNTGTPAENPPQPSLDLDRVSPAFYNLAGTESMLCMGPSTLTACAAWNHPGGAAATARNLSNGATPSGASATASACTTFSCGQNSRPTTFNAVLGNGTSSSTWHRWGYINGNNGWGANLRVGFSGDIDTSDSSDSVFGLGLECTSSCTTGSVTAPAHNTGSGWYFNSGASSAPLDGAARGYLFVR